MTFQRWDPKDPAARNVDTFVLSKGHAAPILWAGCPSGATTAGPPEVGEAAQFASLNGLANIVAIVDVNGLGQSQATPYRHDTGVFARRFASFGWPTIEIDGRIKVRNPASVAVQREAWREFE